MRRKPLLIGFLVWTAVCFAADYTMKSGDTLYALAQSRYGDPSLWQALKYYNGIGNVYSIPVGTPINFPDKAVLEQAKGILADGSLTTAQKQERINGLGGGPAGPAAPESPPNAGTGERHVYGAINAMAQPDPPPLN
jgi:LysM repeat protein